MKVIIKKIKPLGYRKNLKERYKYLAPRIYAPDRGPTLSSLHINFSHYEKLLAHNRTKYLHLLAQ